MAPDVAAELQAMTARSRALEDRISTLPAETVAGAAARARIALWHLNIAAGGLGVPDEDDRLQWAACRDLVALAERAA